MKEVSEETERRLCELASLLDGPEDGETANLLAEFNRLAAVNLPHEEFRGVYGREDYETFVASVIARRAGGSAPVPSDDELREMLQRVLDDPCDDPAIARVVAVAQRHFGVSDLANAFFWPGTFFGHGDETRKPSADEILAEIRRRATGKT